MREREEDKALTGDFQGAIDDINMYIHSKLDSYKTAHRLNKDMIIKYYTEKAGEANAFVNQYENEKNGYWNGYTGQNLTMLKSLMLTIVDLRRAEFLYEGMRYFDILRWNIQISHTDNVTNITKTLHPGDHNRILQIPESASLNGLELNPMTNITERWDNVIYQ